MGSLGSPQIRTLYRILVGKPHKGSLRRLICSWEVNINIKVNFDKNYRRVKVIYLAWCNFQKGAFLLNFNEILGTTLTVNFVKN
jgi:hypothetical protein